LAGLFSGCCRRWLTGCFFLLRVFCHAHGEKVVLLLGGYDKGREPSAKRQNVEIKRVKQRLVRWKAQQRIGTKQAGGRGRSHGKRRS